MPNPYGVPEITPADVAAKRSAAESPLIIDVREAHELEKANLGDGVLHIPLSDLANRRLEALPAEVEDKEQEIIVFCHYGVRSAQVGAFLKENGWTNVLNMSGGIDAYARQVDQSVGLY